jgi:SAM-dependent methyltransferase
MESGWDDLLRCPLPDCGQELAVSLSYVGRVVNDVLTEGLLCCLGCGAPYPVLGDVPILTPSPAAYLAAYRDAVLASLAEHFSVDPQTVALVDDFARAAPAEEPLRFGDDWVPSEAGEEDEEEDGNGEEAPRREESFDAFLAAAAGRGPTAVLDQALATHKAATVLEVGPGAGMLGARLSRHARRLVIADLSLRAVLRSRRRALAGDAEVIGVVAEAEHLPLEEEAFDGVAAANVVDLVDDPHAFLAEARRVLGGRGRLALTTPAPDLGRPGGDDDALRRLLVRTGFDIIETNEDVPWIRRHGRRHYQVFFVQALIAEVAARS